MRFKQTNGQDFKEWCKRKYPDTFITKIGKVTESEGYAAMESKQSNPIRN